MVTPERFMVTPERFMVTPERFMVSMGSGVVTPERFMGSMGSGVTMYRLGVVDSGVFLGGSGGERGIGPCFLRGLTAGGFALFYAGSAEGPLGAENAPPGRYGPLGGRIGRPSFRARPRAGTVPHGRGRDG